MNRLWDQHDRAWRHPAQVASQWEGATAVPAEILRHRATRGWWDLLASMGIRLLVSREYEHLLVCLGASDQGAPEVSYAPVPHPSGIAVDLRRGLVHVASTRNPNQVYDLAPVDGLRPRNDDPGAALEGRPLVPIRSRFYPGSLYMHDLALIGGRLHANAVGENAVIRLAQDGSHERVWWPRAIERAGGPVFGRNHLQLNSIAAGTTVERSFFSASTDRVGTRVPGHRDFKVDRQGVIFSGATREVVVRGLTRPHSARLHGRRLWVANSGYGELTVVDDGMPHAVARLPGWTRGLALRQGVAFVGTSRVIPRFRRYAPGLDVDRSVCGIHAVDLSSGRVLAGLRWPAGNQVFSVEVIPREFATGFPLAPRARGSERLRSLFYSFDVSAPPSPGRAT